MGDAYLVAEVFACILAAIVLCGFILWLLRRKQAEFDSRIKPLQSNFESCRTELSLASASLSGWREKTNGLASSLSIAGGRAEELEVLLALKERDIQQWSNKCSNLEADLEMLKLNFKSKRDDELEKLRGELSNFPAKLQEQEKKERASLLANHDSELASRDASILKLESESSAAELEWEAFGFAAKKQAEEIARLRGQYLDSEGRLNRVANELAASSNDELCALKARFQSAANDKDGIIASLRSELLSQRGILKGWERRFQNFSAERERQLSALSSQLASKEAYLANVLAKSQKSFNEKEEESNALRRLMKELEALLRNREGEVGKLRMRIRQLEPLSAQVAEHVSVIASKEAALDECRNQLSSVESRYESQLAAMEAEVRKLRTVVKVEPLQLHTAPAMHEWDDLQEINGIGPVLEKRLHEEGIYFFRQIANWTDADIDFFQSKLPEFPNRVRRDNWVKSAAGEHLKKYGKLYKTKGMSA